MPVQQFITQPATNSLNAAYQPIVLRVQATSATNDPIPPVVYCDIYINSVFYRTLSNTQYAKLNDANSEWEFPIQSAIQEVLGRYLAPNGGKDIMKPTSPFTLVFCRFRSSTLVDGFIESDDIAPVQATGSTAPVSGGGYQSNTFIVLNTALQHEDNPDLATHLNSFKNGAWDAQAYPLTHRPNRYIIGSDNSDYFPFVYTGTSVIRCLQVTVNRTNGGVEIYNNCEPLPPCGVVVRSIVIRKDVTDHGDGKTYYNATFAVTNTPHHYVIEVSYDNGNTWQDISNDVTIASGVANYNAKTDGTPGSHTLRITPYCDDARAGTGSTASYTLPICPTVTGFAITYNSSLQLITYVFNDALNNLHTVKLYRQDPATGNTGEYAPPRVGTDKRGTFTVIDSGTYYCTIDTPCTVGDNIIETSNSVTITVSNPICNTPFNIVLSFDPDGKGVRGVWQVADQTYKDLVKLYDSDTDTVLRQVLCEPGAFTNYFDVTTYLNIQRFYITVQHQCPSASVIAKSNIAQRTNTFDLSLDYSNDGTSVYVKCHRYGQLAPAPFTATVTISLKYSTEAGLIDTTASGYIISGDNTEFIVGAANYHIITASIISVSPSVSGQYGYSYT